MGFELLRGVVAFDSSSVEVLMEGAPMASPPSSISLKRMNPMDVGTVILVRNPTRTVVTSKLRPVRLILTSLS